MLKYVDSKIVFQEIPDEVSLAISISNCPIKCKGCHSKYLQEDIGVDLNKSALISLIEANKGITCVLFMGGDYDAKHIEDLAEIVRENKLKVALYSGYDTIKVDVYKFDYVKIGHYDETKGGLDKPTTNQILYRICSSENMAIIENITYKFWKKYNYEIEDKSKICE